MAQQVGQFVNPVLQAIKRLGGSARPAEVCRAVAKDLGLEGSTSLDERLSSGVSRFENKIAWVRLYLVLTGYLDRSKRGVWTLTDKGKATPVLSDTQVNQILLEVQRPSKKVDSKPEGTDLEEAEEELPDEAGYRRNFWQLSGVCPPVRLSGSANDFCVSPSLSRSWSPVARAMAESMESAF